MNQVTYRGVFPIAPTAFNDAGELDIDGNRRVLDCMIDQGVDGICILANYSEQFALTDDERELLLDESTAHVAGRKPIIVTCSHYATQVAVARAQRAERAGAAMIMLMPPYHGTLIKADERGILEHFAAIADAVSIPIMIQDAPLAGVNLSVDLLARIAEQFDNIAYFKIEMPGTAQILRALIAAAGQHILGPFDGEESITLMADLAAGATGTMPSALLPDLIKPVVDDYQDGRRDDAAAKYARILPLINFENRQCNLRATKAVMMAGGVIKSDKVRHPMAPLPEATRSELLAMAHAVSPLALRWGL